LRRVLLGDLGKLLLEGSMMGFGLGELVFLLGKRSCVLDGPMGILSTELAPKCKVPSCKVPYSRYVSYFLSAF
jgi:hypothetical protein